MDSASLQTIVLRAFADVPAPARDSIAPHSCLECDELASDLFLVEPGAMPAEILRRHVWDLPLLSAEAKHYYLPAWLLHGLNPDGPWLSDCCSAVLYALAGEHRWDAQPPYTSEQWRALDMWIDYIEQFADDVDHEHIAAARDRVRHEP